MPNINYTDQKPISRYYGYLYDGSVGTRNSNGTGYAWQNTKVRTGSKLPWVTFRTLRNAGLLTSNNLYEDTVKLINPAHSKRKPSGRAYMPDGPWLTLYDDGPWGKYWSGTPPGVPYTNAWFTNLRADATQKAKLKAVDLKVNVAQFFAEYSQTRNLIAGTAVSLAKAFRDVRRGRPDLAWQELTFRLKHQKVNLSTWKVGVKKGHLKPFKNPGSQITKRVSDTWLALQYGWLPLVSDVTSAAELLAQHMVGHPIRMSVIGTSNGTTESTQVGTLYDFTGSYGYTEKIWTQAQAKTGYRLEVTNPDLATLAQTGLDNPLLLAWELLPYSFVVDWFFKVGDYLQALSAFRGVTIRDRWSSLLTTQNAVVEYNGSTAISGLNGSKTLWSRRFYLRSTTVVDPVFYIRTGSGLNLTRFGNSLALLCGAFGRSIPRSGRPISQSLIYSPT